MTTNAAANTVTAAPAPSPEPGPSRPANAALTARLLLAALASVAYEASAVALTGVATWLICRAAEQPPLGALGVAVVLVRALAIARGCFRYVERLAGHDAVLTLMARLRGRFFDALVPLAPGGLAHHRRGDLLVRLASDVDAVQDLLLRLVLPTFAVSVVGGAGVAWFWTVLPAAGAALGTGLVVAGIGLPAAALLVSRTDAGLSAAKAELASRTVDLVDGVEDLLLAGAHGEAARREQAAADVVAGLERRRARLRAALSGTAVLVQLGTCAAVGRAALRGDIDPVMTAVLVLTALALMEETLALRAAAEQLGAVVLSVRRVRGVLVGRVADEPAQPARAPEGPVSVVLTDVCVVHPGAERPALSDVSLNVPAGARVALVGPSGSGKSTVLAVVLRFVRPRTGRVSVGGTDLNLLRGADLRPRLVGGLTQDAALFSGSIRSNLLLADPDADESRLWEVLTRVGAGNWVRGLPHGLDTMVGRQGDRLSGGERQRLSLAVALLSDPAILVLDEPVESLDPETADLVVTDMIAATSGRTVLMVSHRLHGLEEMDEIVVMRHGRVAQRGRHADLVRRPGYYRDAYEAEQRVGRQP
jgi:ATP-binding cassette, subfamily C, bacterial CydC